MPAVLGLFPSALLAARAGLSERAWEREVRSLGLGARSSEMLQLWRVAKSVATRSPDEPFRDITRAPLGNEVTGWPTKDATGIMQNVSIVYRDKTTGKLKQTFYRSVSPNGEVREAVMARAIDAYSANADNYNQELIGAVHTSSYRLEPGLGG